METPLQMGSFSRQSKTIALFAAPVLALLLYWVLPDAYVNGAGASVPVSHAAKACLAILCPLVVYGNRADCRDGAFADYSLSSLRCYDFSKNADALCFGHNLPILRRILACSRYSALGARQTYCS